MPKYSVGAPISHYTAGASNTSRITAATVVGGGIFTLALRGITSFSPFALAGHDIALAVATVDYNDAQQIYPNPSTDKLTIKTASCYRYHQCRDH